ncbi:hypothetical protein STANM309S_00517 [Streptomyces tanashiensis]
MPGFRRDGTTKSRAPSGEVAARIGVAISLKPRATILERMEAMTAERSMMLRCMRSRRRSRKRYSRRRSSLTPSSALMVKGICLAAPRTSTSRASISISPVGSSGLTFSAPRETTLPSTRTTVSFVSLSRTSAAGVPGRATSCVMP